MIKTEKKLGTAIAKKAVAKQIAQLRQEIDDLGDYLDLLEARAANDGKRRYTASEVREKLRLA